MQIFIDAVGGCVNHCGITNGLVTPFWVQAKVCANHLAEHGVARDQGSMTSNKLKVTGNFMGVDGHAEIRAAIVAQCYKTSR